MIRILIVDDEALARQRIRTLLDKRSGIEIAGECRSGAEAMAAIRDKRADLVFLDIQMKDMTGFEVLENLPADTWPMVIFVTAYDQYAIKAFDFLAFDYLLKPFHEERFERALQRAITTLEERREPQPLEALLDYLKQQTMQKKPASEQAQPLKLGTRIVFVNPRDRQCIEASGYYIELHAEGKKYLLRESLTGMLEKLDPERFVRIHRSVAIHLDFLEEINSIGLGDLEVRMKDGRTFRVSKSCKDDLYRKLGLT